MSVLVTGAAGFIGFHVALAVAQRGERVVGIDNLDPYYDVALKRARLARLEALDAFSFRELDITETKTVELSDVNNTEVEIPEEAKKALEGGDEDEKGRDDDDR